MSTILITGAAGYIGSVLVPELLKEGHKVIAVDSFMYNQTPLLDCCHDENLILIRGDVRDKNLMSKQLGLADIVIPLACVTGAPACDKDPASARSTNLDAIRMLLELRSPEQKIIFPTTNSGYGIGQEGILCDERTPLKPISLYGLLKVEAEEAVLESGNSITLRLATVFGISPRMRLDLLVNDFVYRALNDGFLTLFEGHFKRNLIHVRDVGRAFVHCLKHFGRMKNEPYNVGISGCNLSKRELCEEIKKQIQNFDYLESEIGKDPDQRNYMICSRKIEKTGFKTEWSLQAGISELIKGYQIIRGNQYANV